jgi:hypothetical protein
MMIYMVYKIRLAKMILGKYFLDKIIINNSIRLLLAYLYKSLYNYYLVIRKTFKII